jgi:hypothetical protein
VAADGPPRGTFPGQLKSLRLPRIKQAALDTK